MIACDRVFDLQSELQSCHHREWQIWAWPCRLSGYNESGVGDVFEIREQPHLVVDLVTHCGIDGILIINFTESFTCCTPRTEIERNKKVENPLPAARRADIKGVDKNKNL